MRPQVQPLRNDLRPLYLRAEAALAELVEGAHQGDKLPPEPVLAQQLGISRATLREALRSFEDRGLIVRRRGRGTFVNKPHPIIESGLEVLESLDALATRRGLRPDTHDLVIETRPAWDEFAARLGLPEGTPLTVVSRVKTVDGVPVAYMVDAVPARLVSEEEMRAGFAGSVLDFLVARGVPAPAYAQATITVPRADPALAEKLRIRPDAPLILLSETLYSADHEPLGYSRNYFVPEHFSFHVIRRISSQGIGPSGDQG